MILSGLPQLIGGLLFVITVPLFGIFCAVRMAQEEPETEQQRRGRLLLERVRRVNPN